MADGIYHGGPACPLRWAIWGFSALFQIEGHQVLLTQLVTSHSPCHTVWLLVQISLLLPKREGRRKVSKAALHCLLTMALVPWPQRLNSYLWVVPLGLGLGWGSWAQLLKSELPCVCGDATLYLEEMLSRGCYRWRALVVFNLLFRSKKKSVTKRSLWNCNFLGLEGYDLLAVKLQCLLVSE